MCWCECVVCVCVCAVFVCVCVCAAVCLCAVCWRILVFLRGWVAQLCYQGFIRLCPTKDKGPCSISRRSVRRLDVNKGVRPRLPAPGIARRPNKPESRNSPGIDQTSKHKQAGNDTSVPPLQSPFRACTPAMVSSSGRRLKYLEATPVICAAAQQFRPYAGVTYRAVDCARNS